MNNRIQKAIDNYYDGCNCSQAILTAYGENFGLNLENSLKIASGFGGGMGGTLGKCGCVTAMFIVLGLKYGKYPLSDNLKKKEMYSKIQNINKEFEQIFGETECRYLLKNIPEYDFKIPNYSLEERELKPCSIFVKKAAELLEKHLVD